jgi:hypothetical protein
MRQVPSLTRRGRLIEAHTPLLKEKAPAIGLGKVHPK